MVRNMGGNAPNAARKPTPAVPQYVVFRYPTQNIPSFEPLRPMHPKLHDIMTQRRGITSPHVPAPVTGFVSRNDYGGGTLQFRTTTAPPHAPVTRMEGINEKYWDKCKRSYGTKLNFAPRVAKKNLHTQHPSQGMVKWVAGTPVMGESPANYPSAHFHQSYVKRNFPQTFNSTTVMGMCPQKRMRADGASEPQKNYPPQYKYDEWSERERGEGSNGNSDNNNNNINIINNNNNNSNNSDDDPLLLLHGINELGQVQKFRCRKSYLLELAEAVRIADRLRCEIPNAINEPYREQQPDTSSRSESADNNDEVQDEEMHSEHLNAQSREQMDGEETSSISSTSSSSTSNSISDSPVKDGMHFRDMFRKRAHTLGYEISDNVAVEVAPPYGMEAAGEKRNEIQSEG
ncbi:hypothetical protein Tb927.4.3760 [Trypanosoma brucei brucei TREU927]|uniref:T. brucei spp.-specific protein n=1 Tax=Trypanosoma brucei brucei (strain 927/4 GUTat10.1) TaxID=185431 RepID=Q583H0_TRYB2|nr:hypothetical protein Tb927.4.3760 [Trypanosoma brucei brucei TREU927]AAX80207.1 hypothetical protein Tb927.4.3760 [Trypanosoma brucei]AAZ10967.1 hypothetical protein Tb927.4.3760 [Trypanosoma brucei brucei TREU927]